MYFFILKLHVYLFKLLIFYFFLYFSFYINLIFLAKIFFINLFIYFLVSVYFICKFFLPIFFIIFWFFHGTYIYLFCHAGHLKNLLATSRFSFLSLLFLIFHFLCLSYFMHCFGYIINQPTRERGSMVKL